MLTSLSLFTSELVKRVTVSTVLPAWASTTCTGMGAALDVGVAVAVGVPLPTVAVAFGLFVAVACWTDVVGMTVGVAEAFERSEVLGILASTVLILAGVAGAPWKCVMSRTLIF